MWAVIGAGLQIILLLLTKWFEWGDEKKQKVKEILKDVPQANSVTGITRIFDRINRVR